MDRSSNILKILTESFTENFTENLMDKLAESSVEVSNYLFDQYNERANLNFFHRFLAANFDPVNKSKNCSSPSSNP